MNKKMNNLDIKTDRIARHGKIALTIAILCFSIGVVTAIPQQDYTLYGTATLNGKVLTAQDDDVISLKVDGVELVSYTMGDIATDNYVLKVPMDSDPSVTTAAQEGDTAYIYINGIAINEGLQIIGAPGTTVQFDISATSANNPPSVTVLYPNGGESIPAGTQVQVSAHATDDNAVTGVTFYYTNGTNGNLIGAGTIVSGTDKDGTWNKTWNTNGLSAGTNYLIKAVASDGTLTREDQSNSMFSLTTCTPPSTPTLNDPGTTDTDGNYTVSWSSVSGATSYTLEEDTSSSFSSPTVVYSGVGTSTDITGKSNGTYYYRVKACNACGCSGWSNVEDIEVSIQQEEVRYTVNISVTSPNIYFSAPSPIVVPENTTELRLSGDTSNINIDLHLYDSSGEHTGCLYPAGEETNIPNSSYSGWNTDPEVITVMNPATGDYTLKAHGYYTTGWANVTIIIIGHPVHPVHNLNTGKNYEKIQDAIDDPDTKDEHTITVDAGTYFEHVVINKSVKLIGEDKNTTIIGGGGSGKCVHITTDDVEISGFTIRNAIYGVWLESSDTCIIDDNIISDNYDGIYLSNSNDITIAHNCLSNNIVYFSGIHLSSSNNNVIHDNDISKNDDGISLYNSNSNIIYHNNFIDNTIQAYDNTGTNSWDNGPTDGGNYWSGHSCTGNPSDGSQPYYIDSDSVDHYPFQDPNGWLEENIPPVASFTYSPLNPIVGQAVTFDISSSYDPDGLILNYHLLLGDGAKAEGAWPVGTIGHNYSFPINYSVTLTVTDNNGAANSTSRVVTVIVQQGDDFDTRQSENPYPSLSGTHTGTITPSQDIPVQKLYTYPCAGTGGHTEYIRIYGNEIDESASWSGYVEDWDTLTFDSSFTLEAGKTYNYVIKTGSYPQIHHTPALLTDNGWINCTKFTDANGKVYSDWIPAIKLFL